VDAEPSSSESEFFSTVGVSRCELPARTLLRRWLAQLATEVIEELRGASGREWWRAASATSGDGAATTKSRRQMRRSRAADAKFDARAWAARPPVRQCGRTAQ
jgi:hypothetical protein